MLLISYIWQILTIDYANKNAICTYAGVFSMEEQFQK